MLIYELQEFPALYLALEYWKIKCTILSIGHRIDDRLSCVLFVDRMKALSCISVVVENNVPSFTYWYLYAKCTICAYEPCHSLPVHTLRVGLYWNFFIPPWHRLPLSRVIWSVTAFRHSVHTIMCVMLFIACYYLEGGHAYSVKLWYGSCN